MRTPRFARFAKVLFLLPLLGTITQVEAARRPAVVIIIVNLPPAPIVSHQ